MAIDIAIRREDKSTWERRAPLVPDDVRDLIGMGLTVAAQPSKTRFFDDILYEAAGAEVIENIDEAALIVGIKEIPASLIAEERTYAFFSHTIKGQKQNMSMLRRLVELRCNLIDYECVTDEKGRRLIFFGWHAGVAGMVESLVALGRRLNLEGVPNPFTALKQPYRYESINEIRSVLEVIAKWIECEGLPSGMTPLIVGIAGYGNVSRGAQEMLDILPVIEVEPDDLAGIVEGGKRSSRKVLKVVFKEEHMVEPVDKGRGFSLQEYYEHPERYRGTFEKYLPHLTMLVNCIYWDARYPRLVTRRYLASRWRGSPLRVIGDISCDIEGSIEVTLKATDPGSPTYVYDVEEDVIRDGIEGEGPVIMAVDILPSELPRDSSIYFSKIVKPYAAAIARADFGKKYQSLDLPAEIKRALILHRGEFTPGYEHMKEFL